MRYGVVRTDWPEVPVTVAEDDATVILDTGPARLALSKSTGGVTLSDAAGSVLA